MRAHGHKPAIWISLLVSMLLLSTFAEGRSRRKRSRPYRQAMRYFKKGKKLYKKEKFQRAIEMFYKAYKLRRHRNIMLNIAICHAEMGEPVKAMIKLRLAMKIAGKTVKTVLDPKEYGRLLAMKKRIAVLKIEVRDRRAIIVVNGESLGTHKMDRVLYPGSYLVEIKLDGKVRVRRTFKLAGGDRIKWSWSPKKPPPTGRPGEHRPRRLSIAYVALGGALTLVAGSALIGLALKTEQLSKDYRASGGDPAILKKGESYRTATNALIGVTAALAATTVVLAIFTDWRPSRSRKADRKTTVLPFAGRDSAGLVITGRF